jgi:hypothetical protein
MAVLGYAPAAGAPHDGAPHDGAPHDDRRGQWLDRLAQELAVAGAWQADRDPDPIVGHLESMIAISADSDVLSDEDKRELRARVRAATLTVYQARLDFLLEQAMAVARDPARQTEGGDLVRRITDTLDLAARAGLAAPIQQAIRHRLDSIPETAAAGDGVRAPAAAHPLEHRTFERWRAPRIVVALDGRAYTTVDWSLGGAMLDQVEDRGWKCGQPIDVEIGIGADRLHADKMIVVRYNAAQKRLAIRARRFASVLMQVKHDCEQAGMEVA